VAVVTAGPVGDRAEWKALQAEPARQAMHGYVDNVADASHATLLGVSHADSVVRGVEFVRQAIDAETPSPSQTVADRRAPPRGMTAQK
jgi:hypothetical protein